MQIITQKLQQSLIGLYRSFQLSTIDGRTNFDFHFSFPLADPIAVRTRSGRNGKSLNRIPPNAFATAFPISGSTGPSPASPTPLAPYGPSGCGVSTNNDRNSLG